MEGYYIRFVFISDSAESEWNESNFPALLNLIIDCFIAETVERGVIGERAATHCIDWLMIKVGGWKEPVAYVAQIQHQFFFSRVKGWKTVQLIFTWATTCQAASVRYAQGKKRTDNKQKKDGVMPSVAAKKQKIEVRGTKNAILLQIS